jgi:uncharacterized protein YdiU (UPF0061 family)
MRAKLGLALEREHDAELANQLLETMHASHADFTLTFRRLAQLSSTTRAATRRCATCSSIAPRSTRGRTSTARLSEETRDDAARAAAMNRVNPKYVLRNHLAEVAIRRAKDKDFRSRTARADTAPPVRRTTEHEPYAALPPDWAGSLEVSCSS